MLKYFRVVYLENAVTPELMHKIVNYSHVITNDVCIAEGLLTMKYGRDNINFNHIFLVI